MVAQTAALLRHALLVHGGIFSRRCMKSMLIVGQRRSPDTPQSNRQAHRMLERTVGAPSFSRGITQEPSLQPYSASASACCEIHTAPQPYKQSSQSCLIWLMYTGAA